MSVATLSVQGAALLAVAGLAVSGWCACTQMLEQQAHEGRCGRVHARVAWALAVVSGLLAAVFFAPTGGCPW